MVFVSPLRIDGGFALINGLKLDNLRRGAEFRNWGLIRPSEYDFTTQNMIGFQLETVVPIPAICKRAFAFTARQTTFSKAGL
jgi:hypothetical protein